nr:LysR family transcriptional regulator [Thermobacillus sp.]
MNTLWIRAFLEASEHKSLTRAGEKLYLTQPALTKQIRNLEEWLGAELFRRSAQGVELTEEGARFRERILPVLAEIESIRNDLWSARQAAPIRLGTLPGLAAHYLPPRLTELKRQGIRAEMKVLNSTEEIISQLANWTRASARKPPHARNRSGPPICSGSRSMPSSRTRTVCPGENRSPWPI